VRLRLGSRGSKLALWQAHHVAERLRQSWPGLTVDVSVLVTEGDRTAESQLNFASGTGVFVREIETALLNGSIDLAVHSLKDLPTETPEGLVIAATPPRHDSRDALVCRKAKSVAELPPSAVVATGSPRRRSQLLSARPDLRFEPVRGNVDTRLRKLDGGLFDAMILAVAGIERLGLTDAPYTPIPHALCLPAPGQGALAIEIRSDDVATLRFVSLLDDPHTAWCVAAERAFLAALGAGCLAPAGALATVSEGRLDLDAMVGSLDGTKLLRERQSGEPGDAKALGAALARRLIDAGGDAILRETKGAKAPDAR